MKERGGWSFLSLNVSATAAMTQVDPTTLEYAQEHGIACNKEGIPKLQIRASQYGGLGVFANTNIKQGQTLLREDSVMVFTQHLDSEGNLKIDPNELTAGYVKLSSDTRGDLMQLAAQQGTQDHLDKLKSIASINNYAAEITDGKQKCRLALFFSRINHSCAPNTVFSFRTEPGITSKVVLQSVTDIPQDSEITINYLDDKWAANRLRFYMHLSPLWQA